ncbi:4a-hydroxytetrahydrobiopterin dehydratase [Litorivicinus sp.]|jgi:4a-hydroxytetrahydrobiopterin dehydratase|nr:4a-hydroxytetrahydrobiopterin dehydratase [Litorivicinus sp.]MDC1208397.1 4a-hydroxytetrahydrobiopterin dehydratase [Litorivicinus sp.]MDC1240662.1 4a-hydroxytetrahydrobiopterin dehydratase [Litorivicinus sp.]|tara:strand:+ start:15960 stop:16244 length:285 start_codon:yes stop_codon:yes gene_type:complete
MALKYPEGWGVINRDGTQMLSRAYEFDDFTGAMSFAVWLGEVADEYDHHPEITVSWGRTHVLWWSHDEGGISSQDILLAEKTDWSYLQRQVRSC